MATIKISNLHPTGAELFSDSENYMNELSDGEIGTIQGGFLPLLAAVVIIAAFNYGAPNAR